MSRKSKVKDESSIVGGFLYFEDCKQCSIQDEVFVEFLEFKGQGAIRLVSLEHNYAQRVWMETGAKVVEEINTEMTLRPEARSGRRHWYAYRRVHGKLFKKYVGTSENVTHDRLLEVSKAMPSHIKATHGLK
jgi:hypothetical protein